LGLGFLVRYGVFGQLNRVVVAVGVVVAVEVVVWIMDFLW
jgi:hypothetical protein